jgi:hypothetical protein
MLGCERAARDVILREKALPAFLLVVMATVP